MFCKVISGGHVVGVWVSIRWCDYCCVPTHAKCGDRTRGRGSIRKYGMVTNEKTVVCQKYVSIKIYFCIKMIFIIYKLSSALLFTFFVLFCKQIVQL